jgi:AcrR family transcriptional regulator
VGRNQEYRKAETRQKLIEAGTKVFAARGFRGASVEEIAETAGLSTGSIYTRFGSKEALFSEIFAAGISRWLDYYAESLVEDITPEQALIHATEHWVSTMDEQPEVHLLFMEYWVNAMRDPQLRSSLRDLWRFQREVATRIIEEAAPRINLKLTLPASVLAAAFIGIGDGMALQRLIDPEGFPEDNFKLVMERLFGITAGD